MRKGGKVKERITSGHVSTQGNREMVKFRSPREGEMPHNEYNFEHPYPGKPEDHGSLVATGPGMRMGIGATPVNAYGPRRSKAGRQADNVRA